MQGRQKNENEFWGQQIYKSDKKLEGDNSSGNFVFNFNATPSFNSGGDNKATPPTPSFGTSSASSVPSTSKPVFVFGAGAATSSTSAPLRRNYTDNAPKSPTAVNTKDLRRAHSDTISSPTSPFTSGTRTNTKALPTFTFGSQSSAPTFTTASTGAPTSTTAATVGTSAFSFGTPPNTTTPKSASTTPSSTLTTTPVFTTTSPPPPAISFGAPATPATAPISTTTKTPFSFGSSATLATTAAPEATTTTSAPAGTTGFSFGKPATTTPATTSTAGTTSFSFGSSSTPTTSATPSVTKEATRGFSFGTPTTSQKTASATAPSFSFNAPTSAPPVTSTTSTTTTPTLTFGTSTSTTPDSSTKLTPTLGKKEDTAKKSDTPAAPSNKLFVFGSTPTSTTTAPTPSSASGPPSFSFTPSASTSAPVVSTSGPNTYSFSTTLENMQTTANQVPNSLTAVLITPSLNALRQNQVVTHTNFRIDNILPTTRYTELPEQAKKELDELDRYIHGESQRCDHSAKLAIPKRHESMNEATHEQEVLTCKLGSLSSSLQMQVHALEELFDSLKDQIRHFNEGQAVIEACKHPGGRLSRWLYPYSADDDYFVNLSTHLTTRLQEYKDCIREIEFTMDSWMKNKAQSPQDIARVMELQNQTFLSLTDKVAALHERLQLEQDLYTQYRFQSITL
ncbi:unnamed protein product [Absidia cylindrospora]